MPMQPPDGWAEDDHDESKPSLLLAQKKRKFTWPQRAYSSMFE